MAQDIPSEVKRIIKEQLDVDEKDIKPESSFIDDLGADSLGLVELVLAFEEAFEIDIPDEDTEKIRSVQDAIDYIEKPAKKWRYQYGPGRHHRNRARHPRRHRHGRVVGGAALGVERHRAHHAVRLL